MNLFYFIAGVAFYKWIMPLVDILVETVATKLEVSKASDNLIISETNIKIQDMAENGIAAPKRPIGFTSSPALDKEEEDCAENN